MTNLTPRRDDRSFDQLAEILRRQLPTEEWSDHNASDPGIMLLELMSWLGEMALYRMNRVPAAHENAFLEMLIDDPEPVTVDVEFVATFQAGAGATSTLEVPAGTRLASDVVGGRRFVFETYRALVLRRPEPLPVPPEAPVARGVVRARAILEVADEALGISDHTPDQVYALRPPREALGIPSGLPAPILTDFAHRVAGYDPNPRILVNGVHWPAEPSLRSERARITPTEPGLRCMVDAARGQVRFGDETFGAIPPVDAVITCERYQVLEGPRALVLGPDALPHAVNLAVPADVAVRWHSTAPEGGDGFHPVRERGERGLREFREPFRLVTASDFRTAVLEHFADFQERSGRAERFVRATAVVDRRPPLSDGLVAPSHVTLVLVPGPPQFDADLFRDPAVPLATKEAMFAVGHELWQRLRRFLEPRRLITTRLHRETARLRPFTLSAQVVAAAGRNLTQLTTDLTGAIHGFLDPVKGGVEGRGWPLGRHVFRSQLFRMIEDADGVDHVASLSLGPADGSGNVVLGPQDLPLLAWLDLTVVSG